MKKNEYENITWDFHSVLMEFFKRANHLAHKEKNKLKEHGYSMLFDMLRWKGDALTDQMIDAMVRAIGAMESQRLTRDSLLDLQDSLVEVGFETTPPNRCFS